MKKKILSLGLVASLLIMLFFLTGCKEKEENEAIQVNTSNEMINENVMNTTNNETNELNNEVVETNLAKESNTTKEEATNTVKESNTTKKEEKETNSDKKTNTTEKEEKESDTTKNEKEETSTTKNETTQTKPKSATFKAGRYTLHYGTYKGTKSKLIGTSMATSTITIVLNEDKTYTLTSSNSKVLKDQSGTFTIEDNSIILKGTEELEYIAFGDDILSHGSYTYNYRGN